MRKRDNKTWFNIDKSLEKLISQIEIKDERFVDPVTGIEEDGWRIEITTRQIIYNNYDDDSEEGELPV